MVSTATQHSFFPLTGPETKRPTGVSCAIQSRRALHWIRSTKRHGCGLWSDRTPFARSRLDFDCHIVWCCSVRGSLFGGVCLRSHHTITSHILFFVSIYSVFQTQRNQKCFETNKNLKTVYQKAKEKADSPVSVFARYFPSLSLLSVCWLWFLRVFRSLFALSISIFHSRSVC